MIAANAQGLAGIERFAVTQRLTMMVNRYEIHELGPDGSAGRLLALAQQKRMAFKEEVTFYEDEDRRRPVFSFKARQRMDLGAVYDVTDAVGTPIGDYRKDFGQSLLRSTWRSGRPPQAPTARWTGSPPTSPATRTSIPPTPRSRPG